MRYLAMLITASIAVPAMAIDPKDLKMGLVSADHWHSEYPDPGNKQRLAPTVSLSLSSAEMLDTVHSRMLRFTWSGYLYIVSPGEYTFSANVTGGTLSVTVGKAEVFRGEAGNKINSLVVGKPVTLAAGPQPFQAEFIPTEKKNGLRAELIWEGPGFTREPIPYYFFRHAPKEYGPVTYGQKDQIDHGRFLFEEHGCKNCHSEGKTTTLSERKGPTFVDIGKRIYPGWLDAWLADPTKLRPHTTMPKMFADDEHGKTERYAVVQYLTSLGGPVEARERKDNAYAAKRGEKFFTLTGCAACHANKPNDSTRKRTDDDDPLPPYDPTGSFLGLGTATGPQSTYALGTVGSKSPANRIAEYLLDPHKTNPHARMPNMALSNNEARDIAQYLAKQTDRSLATVSVPKGKAADLLPVLNPQFNEMKPDEEWKLLGSIVVKSKCASCHELPQGQPLLPSMPLLAEIIKKPKDGCLSSTPNLQKTPKYSFDEAQRTALQAFLTSYQIAIKPTQMDQARVALKRFMCLNCHTRDGEGGLAAELADKMKSLESAENADAVRPPSLTSIGHKATPEWLKEVLLNKGRARPWMGMRMPQYGEKNVGFLIDALPKFEGTTSEMTAVKTQFDSALVAAGRTFTGKDGYGCIACHDISGVVGGGTRGPDLAMTQNRIKPEWFERWMHNPQRLSPGTKMPQYFLDGKATNGLLNAEPAKHIEAFRAYFSLGMGLPLPKGLEPPKGVVLAVKDRPQLLRTFMPEGAGTRSFAVGYPGNVSIAYDSTQARVAYAWAGNFLDASPVWTNRGGNPAKLLGPIFWKAPAGHPWSVTTGATPPDFLKQANDPAYGATPDADIAFSGTPLLNFDGYSIDEKGNPTFKSTVRSKDGAALTVSETPFPLSSNVATGFGRRFTTEIPNGSTVWFLAGFTASYPKQAQQDFRPKGDVARSFLTSTEAPLVLPQPGDKAIVLTVPTAPKGTQWQLVPIPGGWQAILKIPAGADKPEIVLHTWAVPKDDEKLIRELK